MARGTKQESPPSREGDRSVILQEPAARSVAVGGRVEIGHDWGLPIGDFP